MSETKHMNHIHVKIENNKQYMHDRVGFGTSFDTGYREIEIDGTPLAIYYLNGLVADDIIVQLLKKLVSIEHYGKKKRDVWELVEEHLVNHQITTVDTMDEAVDQILSGLIAIFIDGSNQSFIIDVRSYPGRTPEEPDTERVIRGARDGFTENIVENTALIRRRIRDERLRNEMLRVGERSKTDTCICYIQDVTNEDLLQETKKNIRKIDIDGVTMADKTVEEFLS